MFDQEPYDYSIQEYLGNLAHESLERDYERDADSMAGHTDGAVGIEQAVELSECCGTPITERGACCWCESMYT